MTRPVVSAGETSWRADLSGDGWLLFVTAGVRTFAYGFVSVMLGLYLAAQGLEAGTIGWIFTAALVGGAVMTAILAGVADRLGRRRLLIVGAALMMLAGASFALLANPLLLGIAAILGTMSPSGKDIGPFSSVEQAVIPRTTKDEHRTSVFAAYNLVGSLTGAVGALVVGVPAWLGIGPLTGYQLLMWGYVALAGVLVVLYAQLSPRIEAKTTQTAGRKWGLGVYHSRGTVAKLSALFAVDSFAGGFVVQGLIAYWFHLRWGVDTTALAGIFFGTNLLSALSFLAAAPIARRIGLLNTMVFTHIPSSILLVLVPLMPSLQLAVVLWLARHLISQLDVPTRQSYSMAVIDPDERAAAAGIMAVARTGAAAIAPAFAGATLAAPTLGLPFLIAGGLKVSYDLAVYLVFRGVRPPEEMPS